MTLAFLQTILGSIFGAYLVIIWDEYYWFSPRFKKLPRWGWLLLGASAYLIFTALLLKLN